jgi:hypothetical protein
MSNNTGWKSKISGITAKLGLSKEAPSSKKKSAITDTYSAQKTNGYRKVVEGRQHPARYEAIQDIMSSMMPERRVETEDYIVDIPHIVDVFKQNPFQYKDMEPVVQRYAAVEKALLAQMAEIRGFLNPDNMSSFSAGQITNLQERLEKVEERLGFCRQQQEQAQIYLEWQRQTELADWKESQAKLAGNEDS